MTIAFRLKPGTTFDPIIQYQVDGLPMPLTNVVIASGATNHKNFSVSFTISVVDEVAGLYQATALTDDWPVGLMYWDEIIFVNGKYRCTNTLVFEVIRRETPWPIIFN